MATRTWLGGAAATAQVTAWVFGGTWEATDVVNVTIGTRTVSVVAGSTTLTTVVDNVFAALNLSELPEFAEITWSRSSNSLIGTADTAGVPFTATVSTTETGGGAADSQTIDGSASSAGTNSTACTGPYHADNAQNWSGATLPVNSDTIIFADSDVDCLYGLTGLSALTGITLKQYMSYTGDLGLPPYNENGNYAEYRQRYLQLTGATLLELGLGDGPGSPRFMLDLQATAFTARVDNSGPASSGEQVATFLKGTHTSNVLTVNKGRVGLAIYPGEASALATLNVGYREDPAGDSYVVCGAGVTALTTINQSGGVCHTETNSTTLTMTDGEHVRKGTSTLTTLNLDNGAVRYNSSGTLSTANVGSGGNLDLRQDSRAVTISQLNLNERSEYHDPIGRATLSAGADFLRCTPADTTFDVKPHQTWTPSGI